MRRKEKEITDSSEIESVIQKARICRVGMVDGDRPYVVPMCFGYETGTIYLHSAQAGRKITVFKKNANVCVEFDTDQVLVENEKACRFGMRYASVLAFGKIRFVKDPDSKRHALDLIIGHYREGSFDYPDDSLAQTAVLEVDVETLTGKRSR